MNKFIMMWNDGVYYDGNKNVFSIDEIKSIFEDMIEEFEFEDEDESVSIEYGINKLIKCDEVLFVLNEELCEMGDDGVGIKIVELFN